MPHQTKDRLIDASADLMSRQGYVGTGVKQILAAASAPFGSLYHFFPGGKEQLAAEAVRRSGTAFGELVPLIYDSAPDIVTGTRRFFQGAAETLADSGWVQGCPIGLVALEASGTSEPLREACVEVFEGWIDLAATRFRAAGIPARRSRQLALTLIALLEGGFMQAQAMRSTEPMVAAGRAAVAEVERALGETRHARRRSSR